MTTGISANAAIRQQLENNILKGLVAEWQLVWESLPCSYQAKLKQPFFALHTSRRRAGFWVAAENKISLSRRLVLNCSWGKVRDVLHHEIAHQIADRVGNAAHEPPHGPAFRKACRRLHISPRASLIRDCEDHDEIPPVADDEHSRIVARVKKLFALAGSRNRHEAEAAMQKAHQLVAKHHIELIEVHQQRDFTSSLITQPALRHTRDRYHLAKLIQDFYFIQGIWISAFVVGKGKLGRALEISGTPQNVALAGYVFDFISGYIERQWRRYNRDGEHSRHRKTDFAVGIIEGFRQKLKDSRTRLFADKKQRALVTQPDPQLCRYMRHKHPYVSNIKRRGGHHDPDVINDGVTLGRKLVIAKGLTERRRNGKRLIAPFPCAASKD